MLVLNKADQIFIGERLGSPRHWQLPQGGVEQGQSEEQNVLRELEEELGIDKSSFEILKKLSVVNQYDFKKPPDYAKGRYLGQRQSFWVVRFLGEDKDIKLDKHDQEFSAFSWIEVEKLLDAVDPIRRNGYRPAILELINYLKS
jgi:putative (di)nucleoside polyphosphate hydrolase